MPRKFPPSAALCPDADDANIDVVTGQLMRWIAASMRRANDRGGPSSLRRLADQGMTFSNMGAMHILAWEGERTMTQLAEKLGLSTSAASTLIQRLVDAGHVERRDNPEDRRQKGLALTQQGRDLMNEVTRDRFAELRQSIEPLSAPTRRRLHDVLQDIIEELGEVVDGDAMPETLAAKGDAPASQQPQPQTSHETSSRTPSPSSRAKKRIQEAT